MSGLIELLGDEDYNIVIKQKGINKLSKVKKDESQEIKSLYYDCSKHIKDFINLESLCIDMVHFQSPYVGKYTYINLEKFQKL
jgi:hypothetical protein